MSRTKRHATYCLCERLSLEPQRVATQNNCIKYVPWVKYYPKVLYSAPTKLCKGSIYRIAKQFRTHVGISCVGQKYNKKVFVFFSDEAWSTSRGNLNKGQGMPVIRNPHVFHEVPIRDVEVESLVCKIVPSGF